MAFTNVAGRAGFILELDKSELDRGLPQAERQFSRTFSNMERAASSSTVSSAKNFDGLLGRVRSMQGEADKLSQRLDRTSESTGRLSGGIGSLAGRAGLLGAAAVGAYQVTQKLGDILEVTGEQAYKTEGRFRNLGAELARGDIVGGIQALAKTPQTLEDIGLSAEQGAEHLEELKRAADGLGGSFTKIYEEAKKAKIQIAALNAVTFASRTSNITAGGLVIPIGARPEEGTGSPGLITATNAERRRLGLLPTSGKTGDTGTTGGATPLQNLRLRLASAQRSEDLGTEKQIQSQIVRIYADRVKNTKLTGQALVRFREELSREMDVLDSIQDQIDADAERRAAERQRKAEKAAADRKRAAEKAAAARKKAAEEAARNARAADQALPGWGPYARTSIGFPSEGMSAARANRLAREKAAKAAATDDVFTLADLRRQQFDFLQRLQGINNQFGSNISPDAAQTASHTWRTSKLTEQLVTSVNRLTSGVAHPGAKYTRNLMMEAYGAAGSV